MSFGIILTVAGILVTVVLGAWAIYLTRRYSQRVEVAFVEESCLSLIDDITQGIDDLEIRFQDAPVSESLVLLKGYFANTGRRDIALGMVEKDLAILLPEGFEWIRCKVTGVSANLEASVLSGE